MILPTRDQATQILHRANLITDRLKAAKGLKEIAAEISNALHQQLFMRSLKQCEPAILEDIFLTPANGKAFTVSMSSCKYIYTEGLQGPMNPTDLIAELLAANVVPAAGPKSGKRNQPPSFAYLVSGLSALATSNSLNSNLKLICEISLTEATELAAAAACKSHAETLGEMQRGIEAAAKVVSNHNAHSGHVVAVLQAHRNLIEKKGSEPTKGEVRRDASAILAKKRIPSYSLDDSARWREVFQGAGLSHLKQERGTRGRSRHSNG
jgi:hypothetical protein